MSVLFGNDVIQDLKFIFDGLKEEMCKEFATEFMTIIIMPHKHRILKSFKMKESKLGGDGMEYFLKPF